MQTELLTEPQTAKKFSVSRATLRRMCRDGIAPKPIRIGRRGIRWRAAEVESFLASRPGIIYAKD